VTVLAAQRQALILEEVERRGAVRVSDLVRNLQVSDMTIRRDLDALARQGLVDKVHGGATLPRTGSVEEPGFEAKQVREKTEKQAIARVAAKLVRPGQAIGLSAGTTTWTLAHELREVPGITVVTNSIQVADVLHRGGRADQTVVLTGGVRTPSDALVGPVAVTTLQALNLDLVFMGVHGMDEHSGFTTPNLLEADTDRALAAAGRRLVIVADSSKWGVVGISTFAKLSDADVLVSDEHLDREARAVLQESVGELVIAPLRIRAPRPSREAS
jgi:DeoR/GlpR family transcriptional regulator of sugar metabolism